MKMNKCYIIPVIVTLYVASGCSSQPFATTNDAAVAPTHLATANSGVEDYRIGASDLLDIKVFQADELSRAVRVDAHGNITLPLIGKVSLAGLTQSAAEQKLASIMQQNLLQNPQVTVFIKEYTSQRVTLEGQVNKPGVYPIAGQTTVLQAIAMAQGPNNLAATHQVMLFRREGAQNKQYAIDLDAIRKGKIPDPYVRNDDRIVVPRSDGRYWVREAATLLSPLSTLNTLVN